MERQRGPVVDAISRLLSMTAILLGVGGGYFLYQENQALKQELASVRGEVVPSEDSPALDLTTFQTEFSTRLDAWKTQVNAALEKDDQARQARDRLVSAKMSEVDAAIAKLSPLVSAEVQTHFNSLAAAPNLRLAENRLRPPKEGEVDFVVVTNDGGSEAEIQSVLFRTKLNGQFEVQSHMGMGLDADRMVIEFSSQDNNGSPGRHRDYERTYLVPSKSIPAKRSANISVEIQNSDHVGWGWEGQLELRYNDGKTLFVPSVRAIFVDEQAET